MSLSYSSAPYKGVVQITTDGGTKNVCWESLKNSGYWAQRTVCRHLGMDSSASLVNVSVPSNVKKATFSGSINCNYETKFLSQCSISTSSGENCSELSYIDCKFL